MYRLQSNAKMHDAWGIGSLPVEQRDLCVGLIPRYDTNSIIAFNYHLQNTYYHFDSTINIHPRKRHETKRKTKIIQEKQGTTI